MSLDAPNYRKVTQREKELALLAAAYLYENDADEGSPLTDGQFDKLCKSISFHNASPYLRACVDIKALKQAGSSIAINWDVGIAQLTADMFTPGWTPEKQVELTASRLADRYNPVAKPELPGITLSPKRKRILRLKRS